MKTKDQQPKLSFRSVHVGRPSVKICDCGFSLVRYSVGWPHLLQRWMPVSRAVLKAYCVIAKTVHQRMNKGGPSVIVWRRVVVETKSRNLGRLCQQGILEPIAVFDSLAALEIRMMRLIVETNSSN